MKNIDFCNDIPININIIDKNSTYYKKTATTNSSNFTKLNKKIKRYNNIAFNEELNPEISVVITSYNNYKLTIALLKSIKKYNPKVKYEIIIADDCSTDGTYEILSNIKGIKVIQPKMNSGFGKNVNNAVKFAKGKYIFLMNNDMLVTNNWLDSLYNTMQNNDNIGVLGSVCLNKNGTIQQAGGTIYSDGSAEWNINIKNNKKIMNVDYISGCCILFLKSDWDYLSGFDELFEPAYYEDTDFCFSIKYNLKKDIVIDLNSKIYHLCSCSYNENTELLCAKNKIKFYAKWKTILKGKGQKNCTIYTKNVNYKNFFEKIFSLKNTNFKGYKVITLLGFKIYITKQAKKKIIINKKFPCNGKKNILYIDKQLLQPDTNCGDRASIQYLELLNTLDFNIIFAFHYWNNNEKMIKAMEDKGIQVLYQSNICPTPAHINNWLMDNGKEIDYIYVNRPECYSNVFKEYAPNAKIIYQGHDIHFLREKRMLELKYSKKLELDMLSHQLKEQYIWDNVDKILYFSNNEIDFVKQYNNNLNVKTVPLFIYETLSNVTYNATERQDLLFCGGFNHSPNKDAVLWFCKEIFPNIQKKYS